MKNNSCTREIGLEIDSVFSPQLDATEGQWMAVSAEQEILFFS